MKISRIITLGARATAMTAALALITASCSGKQEAAQEETDDEEETQEVIVEVPANCLEDGIYEGEGDFSGKYPFDITFAVKDNHVAGVYSYRSSRGGNSSILLTGVITPTGIRWQEYAEDWRTHNLINSADFSALVLNDSTLTGNFTNHISGQEREFQIVMKTKDGLDDRADFWFGEVKDLDINGDYHPIQIEQYSSAGDGSIDDYLDAYEKLVDRVISLIDAYNSGNSMSALTEYFEYVGELSTLTDKLENVTGNFSAAQLARFNRINGKYMQAARRMSGF